MKALFAKYLLTLMVTLTPVGQHAFYESSEVTESRYTSLSETMARVIGGETAPDGELLKLGAVMVSIGDAESHWNADVVSCVKGGDGDRAWGPWQTQLPKEKVCRSTEDALRLALGMVKTSFLACKHLQVSDRLSWYTDGKCRSNWKRSGWRMNRALAWVKVHPFTVNVTPSNRFAVEVP